MQNARLDKSPAGIKIAKKNINNFRFFSIRGWGIDLDYCNVEFFALETN